MTSAALKALGFGQEVSSPRMEELFREHNRENHRETDRLFGWLLIFQWLAGIAAALWLAPTAWRGMESSMHLHVKAAVLLGGAIALFTIRIPIAGRPAVSKPAVPLGQGIAA